MPGEHRSLFSSEQGFYGVSAETGDYRFLNLSDIAQDAALQGANRVVSRLADGTKLALWLAGQATNSFSSVAGFAVYDALTGEIDRNPSTAPTESYG